MAIKTQTETFRGFGKMMELDAQTAVECRFGQEVSTVLSVHCDAALTGAESGNGEVRYYGKAHFSVVYEDADRKICRAEKGVEFSASAKDERCFPALTARACVAVENVSVRREGASVYASALLGADISLYGEKTFEYLAGGDLVMRREPVKVLAAHLCGGAAETDDEFETEPLGDILQHTETVCVTDAVCETGQLRIEGEVNLGILAVKGENSLVSFERLVPFRIEIPCDAASFGCGAEARVSVVGTSLHADTDEERGRCKIAAELTLSADACVYEEISVDGVTDAFSAECEVSLSRTEETFTGAGETTRVTERISGKAALSSSVDFTDALQAVASQRAEADLVSTEGGLRVEGVAMATLFALGADGSHRGIEMSLPFSVPVEGTGGAVTVLVCGMSARQKQEGEIEAEATLKIVLRETKTVTANFISSAEEGAPLTLPDCAISVYLPRAGDGLWELAKSLKKPPEEVEASNPDIQFPIREGQRVVIYRKKNIS